MCQQPSRVRHPTFEGYLTRLDSSGHQSDLQSRGNRLGLKRVEGGFEICAFIVPIGEQVLQQMRHPSCMLCVRSLCLEVDTQRMPEQRAGTGNSYKCITLLFAYHSLLTKAYLEITPARDVSALPAESGCAPVLHWNWAFPASSPSPPSPSGPQHQSFMGTPCSKGCPGEC